MFFPVVSHSSVLPYAVPPVLHRSSPSLWSQGVSGEAQEVEVEGLEEGAAEDQQQRDADGHRGAMDIHCTGGLDRFHPGAVRAVDIRFAGLDKVAQTSFLCDLRWDAHGFRWIPMLGIAGSSSPSNRSTSTCGWNLTSAGHQISWLTQHCKLALAPHRTAFQRFPAKRHRLLCEIRQSCVHSDGKQW